MKKNQKMIIFAGPSGSGKSTLAKHILENGDFNLSFSVSAITREKRELEMHGKNYYFISLKEFKEKIKNNEFIEYEEVYKDIFYGTLKSEIERIWSEGKNIIFDIDVIGAMNLKEIYKDKALAVLVKPKSIDNLEKRIRDRGDKDEEQIQKRIKKAKYELTFENKFDKVIINEYGKLEDSKKDTEEIIKEFLEI